MSLKRKIIINFVYLTENLTNLDVVMVHCIQAGILSVNEKEIILAKNGYIAVHSTFFEFLTRCQNQFEIIPMLRKTQNGHLADILTTDLLLTENQYSEEYIISLKEEYYEAELCFRNEHCDCEIQPTLEWRHWKILEVNRPILEENSLFPENPLPYLLVRDFYYDFVHSLKRKHRSVYDKFKMEDLKYLYDVFRTSRHFSFKYIGARYSRKSDFINGDVSVEELHAYGMRPRCLKVSFINIKSLCEFVHLSSVYLSSLHCSVSLENLPLLPQSLSFLHLINVNFPWNDLLNFLYSVSSLEELFVFGNFDVSDILSLDDDCRKREKVIRWFLGNKTIRKHSFEDIQLELILNNKSMFIPEPEIRYPYNNIIVKLNKSDSVSLNICYPELVEELEFKHFIPSRSITRAIAKLCYNVINLKLTHVSTSDLVKVSPAFTQNVVSLCCREMLCEKNGSKELERFLLKCSLNSLTLINSDVTIQLDTIALLDLKIFYFYFNDISPGKFSIFHNSMNALELGLTEMTLNGISISNDTLKLLLFSCSSLEILSLEWLNNTVNLKYIHQSVKHLKIVSTEISTPGSGFTNDYAAVEKLDMRYVSVESVKNALKRYSGSMKDFILWGVSQSIDGPISELIQCSENFQNLELLKLVEVLISEDILTQWINHSSSLLPCQVIHEP